MKLRLFVLGVLGCACLVRAVEPSIYSLDGQGRFLADGACFYIDVLRVNNLAQGAGGYYTLENREEQAGTIRFEAAVRLPEECPPGRLAAACRINGTGAKLDLKLKFEEPSKFRAITLRSSFSASGMAGKVFLIDGREYPIRREPVAGGKNLTLFSVPARCLMFPVKNGVITVRGKFPVTVQEYRGIGLNRLDVMLGFTPGSGTVQETEGSFEFEFEPFSEKPVDLRSVMNMEFRDETAGDREGGWTDQGSNDLRQLPAGSSRFDDIAFDIVDPAKNGGRSCVMLKGVERGYFPECVSVKTNLRGRYLHLLHAAAFSSRGNPLCGTILATYADGSNQKIPVDWRHVGDWWNAANLPDATVAWSAAAGNGVVGLFHTAFLLEDKPLASLRFESAGGSVWGVVAATVSNWKGDAGRKPRMTDLPGPRWGVIDYPLDAEPGSVMDFSARLDAPAGKYGATVVRNGRFEFEKRPGAGVRFFGTNLCASANFMPKAWSDRVAGRLAMFGFNLVRIHHHDGGIVRNGGAKELNTENLDRMDYWIAALAKRGIYVTTDIFVSRRLPAGTFPEYPEALRDYEDYKTLFLLYDSVCEEFLRYMRNILTHRNPYTGCRWLEDPAIVSFSLLNENSCNRLWGRNPKLRKVFLDRFDKYCAARGIRPDGGSESPAFREFLDGIYRERFQRVKAELEKLGCRKPVTDQNFLTGPFLALQRDEYDYVDVHLYHDHPQRLADSGLRRFLQRSAIPLLVEVPGRVFPERIFGKPFAISEIEYCTANDSRAEHAALLGTYGTLQDWNMLVQFTYAHDFQKVREGAVVTSFDIVNDPMRAVGYRFAAAQFLDGGFKPAPKSAVVGLAPRPLPPLNAEFPRGLRALGLIMRVGSVIGPVAARADLPADAVALLRTDYAAPENKSGLPEFRIDDGPNRDFLRRMADRGLFPANCYDAEHGIYRSVTGQLEVDVKRQSFRGVSAKSEVLVIPAGLDLAGKVLDVRGCDARSVIGVISPDGADLERSSRLLLMHCTNISMRGRTFSDDSRGTLESWGEYPILVAPGKARIAIGLPGPWRVFAVDPAGKRLAELPVSVRAGKTEFDISVFNKFGQVIAYELLLGKAN